GENELPVGAYSMSHAAGFGFLYQLTGDKKYADLGKECFEWALAGVRDRDREGRYSFRDPDGALRAGPSLGWYAAGYDLCYDGWDEAYRLKIARAIAEYNEGQYESLEELAAGKRHMPASNHWGMQVGGAALALLAVRDDPGVDNNRIEKLLNISEKSMIRNLTEGFGDHGWFPEGDGTGIMSSNIAFLPALQAWQIAGGKDFISPRPNAPWMTLKWIMLTVTRDGKPDFPIRGAYPQNVWDRDGPSGGGVFCQGFAAVNPEEKSALLWLYNHVAKAEDQKAGAPFDTIGPYPHRAILAFINWPFDLKPANPKGILPSAVGDEKYGVYMFRNGWKDENDIVVSVQTRNTRGWHKADTEGQVWVWGLGKKNAWGNLKGNVTFFQPAVDGSGILSIENGTSLAVDFSGASGADAMLVMSGRGAAKEKRIKAGKTEYSVLFLTAGQEPNIEIRGDRLKVGNQTVSLREGHLALSRFKLSP
ncbi:MAG: hypothetical protein JW828_16950, partial [Sedimentisphaerales bacterium]|nr:hypothetical protein [Sedimentisphaerales bacterium]